MDKTKAMTNKVVDFLIQQDQLPAIKKVDDRILAAERRLGNRLVGLQGGLEAEFIRALRERGRIPSNPRDRLDFVSRVMGVPFENMREVISQQGVEIADVGRQMTIDDLFEQGLNITFRKFSEEVRDKLRNKLYEFSNDTFNRIMGDYAKTLANGYEDGLGIDEVARNLRKDFRNLRDYRLRTIARTEIQGAQNEGSHQTLIDYGARYKQWLTVGDERVRGNDPADYYDHVHLHGQVVEVGEPFSNGMYHPGDRSGDIGDWINCRCRERPYIPRRGEVIMVTPHYP